MDADSESGQPRRSGRAGLGVAWLLLFPFTALVAWGLFTASAGGNPGRMSGAWVNAPLSEWGTGPGGYRLNQGEADRVLRTGYIVVIALASAALLAWRPWRSGALHPCLAVLAGLWGALFPIQAWMAGREPGAPRPPEFTQLPVPDPLPVPGRMRAVAFSRDGRFLVGAGEDRTLRLWDTSTNRETAKIDAAAICLALSPDGATLATGEAGGKIRLWRFPALLEAGTLYGNAGPVGGVAFSPDGGTLAAALGDGSVRLWDAATLAENTLLLGHSEAATCLAFAPDGKTLASGGRESAVRIWDLASKSTVRTLQGPGEFYGPVQALAFSPDGRWFAGGSETSGVLLWETAAWGEHVGLEPGHPVPGLCFSPDSRTLAVCQDQLVKIWTVTGGGSWRLSLGGGERGRFVNGRAEVLFLEKSTLRGSGPMLAVAISPDGSTLASAGEGSPGGLRVSGGMRAIREPVTPGALNLWSLR